MPPFSRGLGGNGLSVGNLGYVQRHVDPKLALQPLCCDREMRITQPGQNHLVGRGVARHLQARVFLEQPRHRWPQLIDVVTRFGVDRGEVRRGGIVDPSQLYRAFLGG